MGSPQRPVVRLYNREGIIGDINLLEDLTLFVEDTVLT